MASTYMTNEDIAKQYNDANAAGDEARRKAALEWFDATFTYPECERHRATIKEMLAEPRLPAIAEPKVLEAIRCKLDGWTCREIDIPQMAYEIYFVTRTALVAPKTKPAWRVKYTNGQVSGDMTTGDWDGAVAQARLWLRDGATVTIEETTVPA